MTNSYHIYFCIECWCWRHNWLLKCWRIHVNCGSFIAVNASVTQLSEWTDSRQQVNTQYTQRYRILQHLFFPYPLAPYLSRDTSTHFSLNVETWCVTSVQSWQWSPQRTQCSMFSEATQGNLLETYPASVFQTAFESSD